MAMNQARMVPIRVSSSSYPQARRRWLNLYRRTLRALPDLLRSYEMMDTPPSESIKCIRERFVEPYADLHDLDAIDHLTWRAETDLFQLLSKHTVRYQAADMLQSPYTLRRPEGGVGYKQLDDRQKISEQQSDFLSSFLEGTVVGDPSKVIREH
jgi:hypothetical protein